MDSSAPLMAQHGNEHEPTLAALQRAAARRGLDVSVTDGRYVVRLQGSQATLWKSRYPERIVERIEQFRGCGR